MQSYDTMCNWAALTALIGMDIAENMNVSCYSAVSYSMAY